MVLRPIPPPLTAERRAGRTLPPYRRPPWQRLSPCAQSEASGTTSGPQPVHSPVTIAVLVARGSTLSLEGTTDRARAFVSPVEAPHDEWAHSAPAACSAGGGGLPSDLGGRLARSVLVQSQYGHVYSRSDARMRPLMPMSGRPSDRARSRHAVRNCALIQARPSEEPPPKAP